MHLDRLELTSDIEPSRSRPGFSLTSTACRNSSEKARDQIVARGLLGYGSDREDLKPDWKRTICVPPKKPKAKARSRQPSALNSIMATSAFISMASRTSRSCAQLSLGSRVGLRGELRQGGMFNRTIVSFSGSSTGYDEFISSL